MLLRLSWSFKHIGSVSLHALELLDKCNVAACCSHDLGSSSASSKLFSDASLKSSQSTHRSSIRFLSRRSLSASVWKFLFEWWYSSLRSHHFALWGFSHTRSLCSGCQRRSTRSCRTLRSHSHCHRGSSRRCCRVFLDVSSLLRRSSMLLSFGDLVEYFETPSSNLPRLLHNRLNLVPFTFAYELRKSVKLSKKTVMSLFIDGSTCCRLLHVFWFSTSCLLSSRWGFKSLVLVSFLVGLVEAHFH
jgi:hypothetical protein